MTMPHPRAHRRSGYLVALPVFLLLVLAGMGVWARTDAGAAGPTYTPPAAQDFSTLSWTQAFDQLHAKLAREYAFTQWKGIDWNALYATYRPRIVKAEAAGDQTAYYLTLREYTQRLRDGHVSIKAFGETAQAKMAAVEQDLAGGGFGLIATRLDDGRVIASWVKSGGPAARAGMKRGARLLSWGGRPVAEALARTSTVLGPSRPTSWRARYEQARYLVRASVGATKTVSFRNRGAAAGQTVRLKAVDDGMQTLTMTDDRSVLHFGWPERLVEHRILPGNVGYVRIYAEIDLPESLPGDHTPTLELFRAAMAEFIDAQVEGLVVDIRANSGGSDQMVADFMGSSYDRRSFYEYASCFNAETGRFEIWRQDETTGEYISPGEGTWIEPEAKRYAGPVVALVNNGCSSSGEGVALGIQNLPNGRVVGLEGTNGSFGMAGDVVLMPGGYEVHWPYGQSLDEHKVVQIDARRGRGGVIPDDRVPMTLRNALRVAHGEDVVLDYGLRVLSRMK